MTAFGKYLNEHLSGSHAALNLLGALVKGHPAAAGVYMGLHASIRHNRLALEGLMASAGIRQARTMEMTARIASHLALLRFRSHGLEHGCLGLVEALEALELGVEGQMMLWRGLKQHQEKVQPWKGADFEALLGSAAEQKALVENLRTDALRQVFLNDEITPE